MKIEELRAILNTGAGAGLSGKEYKIFSKVLDELEAAREVVTKSKNLPIRSTLQASYDRYSVDDYREALKKYNKVVGE